MEIQKKKVTKKEAAIELERDYLIGCHPSMHLYKIYSFQFPMNRETDEEKRKNNNRKMVLTVVRHPMVYAVVLAVNHDVNNQPFDRYRCIRVDIFVVQYYCNRC